MSNLIDIESCSALGRGLWFDGISGLLYRGDLGFSGKKGALGKK